MTGSRFNSRFSWKQCGVSIVERTNPWLWIASLYGLQVLGAVWATHVFGLGFRQTALPIFLLLLGTFSSLILARVGPSPKSVSWKLWIPAGMYALFVASLSHKSFPTAQIAFNTNVFHPLEYMTLGILLGWAWYPLLVKKGSRPFVLVVLSTGSIFAVTDEIHQSFVPGRQPSWVDLGLDFAGLCAGMGLFLAAAFVYNLLKPDCQDAG